jgi:GH3 auxin-responsive promoter
VNPDGGRGVPGISAASASMNHSSSAQGRRWTGWLGRALEWRLARRIRLLSDADHWKKNSGAIQRRQLRGLLSRAQKTEFGRAHGFGKLAGLSDRELLGAYHKAVPVADWYAYKGFVERMREGGEPDVLWPGVVRDFAQTSGTTSGDKFIPVSRAMLRSNFRASMDIFANLARLGIPLPSITAGRVLFLGGSTDLAVNEHGIRTGDLSGLVTPLIRWPITRIYSPGRKIALMNHWPSKIEAMAEACLDQDVRMISGMPSWAVVLFERLIARARLLGRDVSTIREIWPNLQVFVHGGVRYSPFDARVRQFWSGSAAGDDVPHRLELYPASEGFVAMQDGPASDGASPPLRLNTDIGLFHEFVPLEQIDDPAAQAFACDEVEKGQKYVVVLSTCAGLWRYVLGDVVEFDSVPQSLGGKAGDGPARLRIVGRHRHFINAFGENLIVEHIENAVAEAARRTGVVVGEFTAAPVYPRDGRKGAVELAVEIQGGGTPEPPVLEAFRDALDERLKKESVDYQTKRTDGLGMAAPIVSPMPIGSFNRWLEARGKLGGQHKCPRCANGREIIEGVLAVARGGA